MREVFATAAGWLEERRPFALATLVALRQARTAPLGTTIAVDRDGHIVGNIGAGCYESEIVEAALKSADDGSVRRLDINLDVIDEVIGGSACGAVMQLVVWRPQASFVEDARAIAAGERAVTLRIDGFEAVIESKAPLLLVGATALAADIATVARRADFRVVVIDPRPAFATSERVPDAHEIVRVWPDEYLSRALNADAAVVVLSHDSKFDAPALAAALRSQAYFVGLLGSRRSQAARRESLRAMGFDDDALARIHGPVGLDIGGESTGETAVSIVAEVIAVRRGRRGLPLIAAQGAIH